MNRRLHVLRNFGYLMLGKTFSDAAAFLVLVLVSRTFGQEGVGHYSFAVGLTGLVAVIADAGLYMLGVKELSRIVGVDDDRALAMCRRLLRLRYLLAGVATFVLLLLAAFVPAAEDVQTIVLVVGAFQILAAIVDGYGSVLVAREEMSIVARIEMSMRGSIAVLAGAAIVAKAGLVVTLLGFPLSAAVHAVVAHVVVDKRIGGGLFRGGELSLTETFRLARPYGVAELLRYLSTRLDVVFLGFMLGSAAAGVYNVAYRFLFLLAFVPYYATIALFPSLSRMYDRSRAEMPAVYAGAIGFALLVGVPGAAGLWFVAEDVITLVFGAEFAASAAPLRWLAWLFLLSCLDNVMGTLLTSCNLQPARTRAQWIAAGTNAAGNAVLIPILGVVGAAVATLSSATLLVVLYARTLRPVLGWPRCMRQGSYAVLGTGAFLTALGLVPSLPLALSIPLAALVYAVVLVAMPGFRRTELRAAIEAIRSGDIGRARGSEHVTPRPRPGARR